MDIPKWLDDVFEEYQKTREEGDPPWYEDPDFVSVAQDAFLLLTSAEASDIPTVTSLVNPWMRRLFSLAFLGAHEAVPSDFIEEQGRIRYVSPTGGLLDFQEMMYLPEEALGEAKVSLFRRLFGSEPSATEANQLRGLDIVERFSLLLDEPAPGVPETVQTVNRVIGGGSFTSQKQARTLYNAWLSNRQAEGYDTEELAKEETFARVWRAYEGSYAARSVFLSYRFQDFLEDSVTPNLPAPEEFALGEFMKNQAALYRRVTELAPEQAIPEQALFLLERGFPVAEALLAFQPRHGETYASYKERTQDSGYLGRLAGVLNATSQEELTPLSIVKPRDALDADSVRALAIDAGLIQSPSTFQDAAFRSQGRMVPVTSPPGVAFEEYISSNLQDVLAAVGPGFATTDYEDAYAGLALTYARTLPAEEQLLALESLMEAENEFITLFMLQEPELQRAQQMSLAEREANQRALEERLSQELVAENELERKERERTRPLTAEEGGETFVAGDEESKREFERQRREFEAEQQRRRNEGLITQEQQEFEVSHFQPASRAQLTREASARGVAAISRKATTPRSPFQEFVRTFDFAGFAQRKLATKREDEAMRQEQRRRQRSALQPSEGARFRGQPLFVRAGT